MPLYGNMTIRVHIMGVYACVGRPMCTSWMATYKRSPARPGHLPLLATYIGPQPSHLLHFLNTRILPFPLLLVGGEVVSREALQVWQWGGWCQEKRRTRRWKNGDKGDLVKFVSGWDGRHRFMWVMSAKLCRVSGAAHCHARISRPPTRRNPRPHAHPHCAHHLTPTRKPRR